MKQIATQQIHILKDIELSLPGYLAICLVCHFVITAFNEHLVHHSDGEQIKLPDGKTDLRTSKEKKSRCHRTICCKKFF